MMALEVSDASILLAARRALPLAASSIRRVLQWMPGEDWSNTLLSIAIAAICDYCTVHGQPPADNLDPELLALVRQHAKVELDESLYKRHRVGVRSGARTIRVRVHSVPLTDLEPIDDACARPCLRGQYLASPLRADQGLDDSAASILADTLEGLAPQDAASILRPRGDVSPLSPSERKARERTMQRVRAMAVARPSLLGRTREYFADTG